MYVWMNRVVGARLVDAIPCDPGWLVPAEEAAASPFDRGLLLGDGLFETILVRHGLAPLLPFHEERLAEGCRLLGYPPPPALGGVLEALISHGGLREGVIRVTCTRGEGPRGYRPPEVPDPFCVAALLPPSSAPEAPWRAVVSDVPTVPHPILSRIKHTSALARIVALREAEGRDADEVLFCTPAGAVVEGTATNIFWVTEGALHTPAVEATGCLPGVGRRWVIEWAENAGVRVHQGVFPLAVAGEADEAFLTNAVRGPIPLGEVVGHRRWEAPGPLTARLMAAWRDMADRSGPP
ncbi:aminotransferase class IV [Limnochorda pilosa]|uniref:4-amino-4-deoxychorismate lyase n=1 Tax=Limnochorda pilosa TaxID=1555112 RepID=A0A0K2SPZ1_LIMPI|nr:aminotransferase class IV [Limnochorda pilosa]BAS29183.1 4-amino-4-deoxychorismate lyase [Limnochorda pilosa]